MVQQKGTFKSSVNKFFLKKANNMTSGVSRSFGHSDSVLNLCEVYGHSDAVLNLCKVYGHSDSALNLCKVYGHSDSALNLCEA